MKLFSYTLLLAAAAQGSLGAILERNSNPGGCNANNCARAVTGTRGGEAVVTSHRGDCSSFMQTTVGPGTTIVIPTDVPTYASACTGPAAYSSACSCWGVTPTTIPVNDCRDPGECGTFDIIYDASCGLLGVCVCAYDADGRYICVQDQYCTAPDCNTDSDCGPGGLCWARNCCGRNICTVPGDVCSNPARVFKALRNRANGDNCTGSHCGEAKRARR